MTPVNVPVRLPCLQEAVRNPMTRNPQEWEMWCAKVPWGSHHQGGWISWIQNEGMCVSPPVLQK